MGLLGFQEIKSKLESYCAYQDRSLFDVEKKISTLTNIKEEEERIISSLIKDGFLNQDRFIESFVKGKVNQKRWGKEKIRSGLIQHKIPKGVIDSALKNIDKEKYQQNLLILAQKKSDSLNKETNAFEKKAKILRFLYSKGYQSSDWENVDFSALFAS
jgi:regulatory protein